MNSFKSRVLVALASLAIWGLPGIIQADISPDVTFRASYEKGYAADTAAGNPEAKVIGAVGSTEGISDKAIIVGEKGWLQYSLRDNIRQDDVPGSIEMWIKPVDWDGASTLGSTLFSADYDNTGKKEDERGIFRLYTQGNGRLTFIAGPYPQDVKKQVWAQTEITGWKKGEWHQVVATWDGVDIVIYIDGEQKARNKINIFAGGEDPRFKPSLGEAFTVGGSAWGKTGDTAIDEVTIFRKALRPGEVLQRYGLKSGLIRREKKEPETVVEKPSMLPLPVSTAKPGIDGVISAGEWDDASSVNNFIALFVPEKKLWPYGNRLYCKAVEGNLYLGFTSEFNRGLLPAAEFDSNSGKVFMDDCFEIFLTTGRGENDQVYQFVVNSRGNLDVYKTRPKGVLISAPVKAAASVSSKSWSVELEIPFSLIVKDFSGALPERLFMQVSRSYKKGTVAEREKMQASLGEDKTEEYAGFPWNTAFLDVKNYAELVPSAQGRYISCRIDLEKFAALNRLVIDGRYGKGSEPSSLSLKATLAGAGSAAVEAINAGTDGSFAYEKDIPEGLNTVRIEDEQEFNISIPVSRRQALVLKNTIFSFNDTMEVTVDFGGMAAPSEGFTAELSIKNSQDKRVAGKSIKGITSSSIKEVLSIAGLPAGKYVLECAVRRSPEESPVATERNDFQVFRGLPGEGLFDSLTEEVPAPWTPVEVNSKGEIGVWGRIYRFGDNFLPESIRSQGGELLSAPGFYEVRLAEGKPFRMEKGVTRIIEQKPVRCRIETTGISHDVSVRQVTTVEYDGMMRYDVEVESKEPITCLTLNVPYLTERAQVFQPGYFRGKFNRLEMNAIEITPRFSWTSEYLYPAFWISDMHAGLSWFAATDRTWVVDEGMEKMKVTKDGFVIHFVNTDKETPRSIKFTFGMEAFPTKPARDDWREFGRVLESRWMSVFVPDDNLEKAVDGRVLPDYFTRILPDLWYTRRLRGLLLPYCNFPRSVEEYTGLEPELHERMVKELYDALEKARKAGFEYVIPYLCPTYATMSIPEWKFYWSNWIAIPKHIFDSYGQPCVCVANKQWCDFWLYSFQKYVEKYKIKGVFHDMALPYAEEGTLNGLGYDKNGIRYPEYPIWELRDLYKKIYIIHRKLFPDAMSFMNYGHYLPAIHSFADFLLCAERYETRADRSIYDLDGDGNIDSFRWQSSLPFGPKAMHNGWLKYQYAMNEKGPTVHMYGVVLLHDLVQWNINENPEVRKGIHELKKKFGIGYDRAVEFLPYWDNQDRYHADSQDIVVSFYRCGQKLMAILVNKRMKETFNGRITMDLKKLNIKDVRDIQIYDPMDNTYQVLKNEGTADTVIVNTEVSPTLFKAVLLN